MNTKTVVLTLILVIGFVFPNCVMEDEFNCNCPPIDGEFFDIQGFQLYITKVLPNGNTSSPIEENETVSFDEYHGILLNFDVEFHSQIIPKIDWNLSLMPTTLACSCIENGFEGSKTEKLKNLTVITKNDFSSEYLAGDTINNLMEIRNLYFSNERVDLETYLQQDTMNIMALSYWLHLKSAPQTEEDFQLKIVIELPENEVYEAETLPIKIIN